MRGQASFVLRVPGESAVPVALRVHGPHHVGNALAVAAVAHELGMPVPQIAAALANAAGVEPRIVHVTSDHIAAADPEWGASLLGDKAHSSVFDTRKLRQVVPDFVAPTPFEQGAREIVAWHDEDPSRRTVDPRIDALMDDLVRQHGRR